MAPRSPGRPLPSPDEGSERAAIEGDRLRRLAVGTPTSSASRGRSEAGVAAAAIALLIGSGLLLARTPGEPIASPVPFRAPISGLASQPRSGDAESAPLAATTDEPSPPVRSLAPATVPRALVGATARTAAAVATERGCGAHVTPGEDPYTGATCVPEPPSTPLDIVEVELGEQVTFAVPGWTITSLVARCNVSAIDQPTVGDAGIAAGCPLAARATTDPTSRLLASPPARGDWMVEVGTTLARDGSTYDGSFFFDVLVR